MRAKEFVVEQAKFTQDQLGPMTSMMRYDGLDNSNPYAMWRFLVACAEQPLEPGREPFDKKGPTGQKLVTLAYTTADAEILRRTAEAMGEFGTVLSTQESTEPTITNTSSPISSFKGYER